MKRILTVLLLTLNLTIIGQFGIIEDKDGYVNIRNSAKNIIDTLSSEEIVYCFDLEGEWFRIDYDLSRQNRSGYVHKSRVRIIENFDPFYSNQLTDTSIVFSLDSIRIQITKRAFNAKSNSLQYHEINEAEYLEKINGKEIWGTDGEIPKMKYGIFSLQLNNEKVILPTDNLFEPNFGFTSAFYDERNNSIYISALNSDGAGGYSVLWIIEKGVFKQRITTIPF
ncbi:hypothetical protein [Brumimicrobium aurantiacum]|uniref:SH3 domain-containing protein n=1 Tax=Brumimicrobium aurantiacum TaxID=1737063 RepID=A0A3E1EX80_9FLAO|nr:hypothetical protein [Brumimicrobium aurantiacum]RFC54165.1 hypothetical protein DXU93_09265 [Brumimicrobium aurantiacum]